MIGINLTDNYCWYIKQIRRMQDVPIFYTEISYDNLKIVSNSYNL